MFSAGTVLAQSPATCAIGPHPLSAGFQTSGVRLLSPVTADSANHRNARTLRHNPRIQTLSPFNTVRVRSGGWKP